MSITTSAMISTLENVLFESATLATANASTYNGANYNNIDAFAAALANSPEFSIGAQVIRCYVDALGRAPAGIEIDYYVNIAEQGMTTAQIAQGATAVSQSTWDTIAGDFTASPEFAKDFALSAPNAVTSSEYTTLVDNLYQNVLDRAPASSEAAYYTAQLQSGFAASTLVQEFSNSPEFQSDAGAKIQSLLVAYNDAQQAGVSNTAAITSTPLVTTPPVITSIGPNGTLTLPADNDAANYITLTQTVGTQGPTPQIITLGAHDGGSTIDVSAVTIATESNPTTEIRPRISEIGNAADGLTKLQVFSATSTSADIITSAQAISIPTGATFDQAVGLAVDAANSQAVANPSGLESGGSHSYDWFSYGGNVVVIGHNGTPSPSVHATDVIVVLTGLTNLQNFSIAGTGEILI